jgi:hypothetical protein
MVLCFVAGLGLNQDEIDLCLVPDKPDSLSVPVRVKDLSATVAAFQRIGPEEGVTTTFDEQDGALVINALNPASIYLTPNLPQSPGYRVRKVKILLSQDGSYRTLYEREGKGWEEWIANRERQ